jgi:hypothetical protein
MAMDDLESVLGSGRGSSASDSVRAQVWALLDRRLRWRRLWRRLGWAGLAACFYVAGWTTDALMHRRLADDVTSVPTATAAVPEPSPSEDVSPLTLEWQALDSAQPRPNLFRWAGDRYLAANDLAAAFRCYRNALRLSTAADREIKIDDSWLLMTLKVERKKEKSDAHRQS